MCMEPQQASCLHQRQPQDRPPHRRPVAETQTHIARLPTFRWSVTRYNGHMMQGKCLREREIKHPFYPPLSRSTSAAQVHTIRTNVPNKLFGAELSNSPRRDDTLIMIMSTPPSHALSRAHSNPPARLTWLSGSIPEVRCMLVLQGKLSGLQDRNWVAQQMMASRRTRHLARERIVPVDVPTVTCYG